MTLQLVLITKRLRQCLETGIIACRSSNDGICLEANSSKTEKNVIPFTRFSSVFSTIALNAFLNSESEAGFDLRPGVQRDILKFLQGWSSVVAFFAK